LKGPSIRAFILGISVNILALGVWFITGTRSWNPAFTISAYCYPITSLLGLVSAYASIPWGFYVTPALNGLAAILTITCIIRTIVIVGYGIIKLTKTPLITGITAEISWVIIGILATWAAQRYVILSLQYSMRNMISQTYFPQIFTTAAGVGNNP
jgi:hypothetical protein